MSNVTCDENCAECGRWTTMHSNENTLVMIVWLQENIS